MRPWSSLCYWAIIVSLASPVWLVKQIILEAIDDSKETTASQWVDTQMEKLRGEDSFIKTWQLELIDFKVLSIIRCLAWIGVSPGGIYDKIIDIVVLLQTYRQWCHLPQDGYWQKQRAVLFNGVVVLLERLIQEILVLLLRWIHHLTNFDWSMSKLHCVDLF